VQLIVKPTLRKGPMVLKKPLSSACFVIPFVHSRAEERTMMGKQSAPQEFFYRFRLEDHVSRTTRYGRLMQF
jgi:hypothetical protein